jgi:2-polyprenyl-3-methyl-5-hydroxy-6-metoxy-1,4-benzoquinol methylase
MVAARQKLILDMFQTAKPNVVVEIGCGTDLLYKKAIDLELPIKQWIIVEPSDQFIRVAKQTGESKIKLYAIHDFIEDSVSIVNETCESPPDFVVCSGVLHEVENPGNILSAAKSVLSTGGTLHVNVPNAFSLHRRLARAMGLIKDEKEFSERNKTLSQFHVFDINSLMRLVEKNGFKIETSGGYFLKPFTHSQMESINTLLSPDILDGLFILGQEYPDLASEIYINAKVK